MVPYKISDMQTMAEAVAKSGLFGMKTYYQALALMLVAQAENQHPATITQDYDIIQNKACRKTHSVLARFQQMGGKVEWHQLTELIADATFSHPSGGALRMTWTFEQAKKAKLTGKDNWQNYPRAMLRARCIAEGVRAVYPAAIGGMMVSEEATDAPVDTTPIIKDMGKAERVVDQPVYYCKESFDANIAKWTSLIVKGTKTAEQIIAKVQSNVPMTPEQIKTLKDIKREEKTAIEGEVMTEEEVAAARQREIDEMTAQA